MNLLNTVKTNAELIAKTYNVDIGLFLLVYLLSFIPFYLGYFLIIYGTTRSVTIRDFFTLKLHKKIRWSHSARMGLLVHMFGRLMPYVYILFFGRNLPLWLILIIVGMLVFSLYYLWIKMKYSSQKGSTDTVIIREDEILDHQLALRLWNIYDHTFKKLNKRSPCKQSLDLDHFMHALKDPTVRKYLIKVITDGSVIGIALVTNNFTNTPWISEDFFKEKYADLHKNGLIYYFIGLAISEEFRGRKYSIRLIERIIDELPTGASMGFDHSMNINPMLHHFTKIVKQAHLIERTFLDKQHYHIVRRSR